MGLREIGWGRGLNLSRLRQMAGCCEHGNKHSGSAKCWKFLASRLFCQSLRQLVQAEYKEMCEKTTNMLILSEATCRWVWERVVSSFHRQQRNAVHNVKCEIYEWKYGCWRRRLEQLCSAKQAQRLNENSWQLKTEVECYFYKTWASNI